MDAIVLVRLSLEESKRRGLPWRQAWRRAAAQLPRSTDPDAWVERVILARTRDVWRRAYCDLPAARGEIAAGALIDALREHEPTTALLLA